MLEALIHRASTIGLRRGLTGNRMWLLLGIVAVGMRTLRRIARSDEQVLYRTVVQAGDIFEIIGRQPGD
jgi:hypothetical protein